MADFADVASAATERALAQHLENHRLKTQVHQSSAFYCIECDDVIPHQRRAAIVGVQTCVSCQADNEKKRA